MYTINPMGRGIKEIPKEDFYIIIEQANQYGIIITNKVIEKDKGHIDIEWNPNDVFAIPQ